MNKTTYTRFTCLSACSLAFLYILLRALLMGVTYDEVWTIRDFVSQQFLHIINYTPSDANNHILNTLLIKVLFLSGNHALFLARLPNVLAGALYIGAAYKLAQRFLASFLSVIALLLLLFNPFLLDFFSLARGYGLSLGFMMASLYYACRYMQEHGSGNALKAMSLAALAVLSNFALLNYWLMITAGICIFFPSGKADPAAKRTRIYALGVTFLLAAIIYEPLRKLKQANNLYYGGSTGFYHDTLSSLAKYSCYSPEPSLFISTVLQVFLAVLLLSILLSYFFNRNLYTPKNMILAVTVLCIASIILQHLLLDNRYLIDRGALFFYPLFILCLCFSWNDYIRFPLAKGLALVFVILSGINFFRHANFYKTALWDFDAHTREVLQLLNEKGKQQKKPVTLDFSWPFQSSMEYYATPAHYPFVRIVKNTGDREDLNGNADYYLFLTRSLEKVGYDAPAQKIGAAAKDTLMQYKDEHMVLFTQLQKDQPPGPGKP